MTAKAPDDEWETVANEAPTTMEFDVGDDWEGEYLGHRDIELPGADGDTFRQDSFRGADGVLYAVNPGVHLREALDRVPIGSWTKLTRMRDVPLGEQRSPMKSFRVQVRKLKNP